jgi:hypothetical protein
MSCLEPPKFSNEIFVQTMGHGSLMLRLVLSLNLEHNQGLCDGGRNLLVLLATYRCFKKKAIDPKYLLPLNPVGPDFNSSQ